MDRTRRQQRAYERASVKRFNIRRAYIRQRRTIGFLLAKYNPQRDVWYMWGDSLPETE